MKNLNENFCFYENKEPNCKFMKGANILLRISLFNAKRWRCGHRSFSGTNIASPLEREGLPNLLPISLFNAKRCDAFTVHFQS